MQLGGLLVQQFGPFPEQGRGPRVARQRGNQLLISLRLTVETFQ